MSGVVTYRGQVLSLIPLITSNRLKKYETENKNMKKYSKISLCRPHSRTSCSMSKNRKVKQINFLRARDEKRIKSHSRH